MHSFQTAAAGAPLETVSAATPRPTGTEVLLRTLATGVCHSDVHLHDAGFDLGAGKTLPAGQPGMVLGHEIAGTVVASGPAATGVEPGAVCVVYPWIGCNACALCTAGNEHLCEAARVLGIQRPGGFADHVLVPHPRYLFPVGALPPAVACTYACSGLTAYSALKKLGPLTASDPLVIVGAGGVGLNAVHMAPVVAGVRPVVADISADRRRAALDAGATAVVDAAAPDAVKALRGPAGGAAAAIDFVGSEASVSLAQRCLRKGGRLVIVGLFGGTFSMPLPLIPMLARTIVGSYVGSLAEMRELMALAQAGRLPALAIDERPASAAAATAALADLRQGAVTGRAVLRFPPA